MSAIDIGPEATAIIERLRRIDKANPVIDKGKADAALQSHIAALGLAPMPVRWVEDGRAGYLTVFKAAQSAAWTAVQSAAMTEAETPKEVSRWIGVWLPFVDAAEAGLWLFWVTATEIVAVPRPSLRLVENRLHCATGPAVSWPNERYWFWRGVQVSRELIEAPDAIDIPGVLRSANQEVRRATCEVLGWLRVLAAVGAREIQRDDYGVLLETNSLGDGDDKARFVKVKCPSTDREYMVRVPPGTRSAHAGVAWTFQVEHEKYAPEVET